VQGEDENKIFRKHDLRSCCAARDKSILRTPTTVVCTGAKRNNAARKGRANQIEGEPEVACIRDDAEAKGGRDSKEDPPSEFQTHREGERREKAAVGPGKRRRAIGEQIEYR
jgi:hypothetical protein